MDKFGGGVPVIIFGTGRFAEVVYCYLEHDSPHKVAAFTASNSEVNERRKMGLPLVPFEEIEEHFPPGTHKMFIAVGYNKVNQVRAKFYHQAQKKGYDLKNDSGH